MAIVRAENLTFYYPKREAPAIANVSFSLNSGDFAVLFGPSGCGKSTLLRQLKPTIKPHGNGSGRIFFNENPIETLNLRTQSADIGFVGQSAENQIVTDKVWHELAFGLESLGESSRSIRRRVAEMAAFFGIEDWFYKNVAELSGGQKQLLNLASVMVMQPQLLILDEPTAQLDPIAASDFLSILGKVNRELGTTVLMTEHRLEEVFSMANAALMMDEGRIILEGSPEEIGKKLKETDGRMFSAMPAAMQIWAAVNSDDPCPVSVRDGRNFLSEFAKKNTLKALPKATMLSKGEPVLRAENVWFKYEKDLPFALKGLSLTLHKGSVFALLGSNGAGKSTALKLISGFLKPSRGEISVGGKTAMLPQNPQALFTKKTVSQELSLCSNTPAPSAADETGRIIKLCRLEKLLNRHPYDLSGGEQQRVALAKVLLTRPDILLLDEPTKGLDMEFKEIFADILKKLTTSGVSVIMVSHDVEFCAKYTDYCGLLFDGGIVTKLPTRAFFSENCFYTTAANRIARQIEPDAVTTEDVIAVCGGELPNKRTLTEGFFAATSNDIDITENNCVKTDKADIRLPLWRKIAAAVCGLSALLIMIISAAKDDLTSMVTDSGLTAWGKNLLGIYLVFCTLLFLCVAFVGLGRQGKALKTADIKPKKKKLSRRTTVAAISILLLIPLTLFIGVTYINSQQYGIVCALVLFECMAPFFLVFEGRKPKTRELVVIAVLCAISVAGRAVFFMLPQFKPVLAMTIISGIVLGAESGFLVGAVSMLASNMLFSQGPWTPWQMFSMGIIGFLAGILFEKGLLRRTRTSMSVFGAFSAIVIYGGIMNPASMLIWAGNETFNLNALITYYVTGFPMDCVHAAATVFFLTTAAEPMLEKLDRIKTKYGLLE